MLTKRCFTSGVSRRVSAFVYNELFELVEKEEDKEQIYKFKLNISHNGVQIIEQSKEGSRKKSAHLMVTNKPVTENIVVLKDEQEIFMLLESEAADIMKKVNKTRKKRNEPLRV